MNNTNAVDTGPPLYYPLEREDPMLYKKGLGTVSCGTARFSEVLRDKNLFS